METIDNTNGEIAATGNNTPAPAGASPAQRPADSTDTADPSTRAAAVDPTTKPSTSIPLADHERIVNGFHKRVDDLAWARGYDPDTVRRAVTLMEQRERAERARGAQTPPEPQPDAKDPTSGELFYTPKQAAAWAAWRAEQIVAAKVEELEGRFGPIEQRFAQTDKQESLGRQIEAAAQWPAFADHVDEITAAIVQANQEKRKLTLEDAYIRIVVPKLAASKEITYAEAKKAVLAEMSDTNDAAKDDLNPGRQPGSSRKSYDQMTTREIVAETRKELEAKRGKAS